MRLSRRLRLAGFLGALLSICRIGFAAPELQPQSKNLAADRAAIQNFFDGLSKGVSPADAIALRERMAAWASMTPSHLTTADFNEAGKDPVVTAHAVANAAIWSAIAAHAVGTAQQLIQAKFISGYGSAMAASTSSPIAKAGTILLKQADQVMKGNRAGAMDAAKEFGNIPLVSFDPSTALSSDQKAKISAFEDITAYDWGSTWMALGQAVLAAVAGFIQGGIYGAIIALVLSLVVSLATGSFSSQTHTLKKNNNGGNANTSQAWAGQAGAAILGGQVGRSIQQSAGVKQGRGTDSTSGGPDLPAMQGPDGSANNVEIKASGGSSDGKVLPGGQ